MASDLTIAVTGLLTPLFAVTGCAKVCAAPVMRTNATHLGFTVAQFRIIGMLEVAGAAGLAIGLAFWPLGAASAGAFVLMMLAAAVVHHMHHDPAPRVAVPLAVALLAVAYLIALH